MPSYFTNHVPGNWLLLGYVPTSGPAIEHLRALALPLTFFGFPILGGVSSKAKEHLLFLLHHLQYFYLKQFGFYLLNIT